MKLINYIHSPRTIPTALLLFCLIGFGNSAQVFAHGGEDHGEAKPKTETNAQGAIAHTTRLGEIEVMLKHPLPTPDAATEARLFVTKYETNEAFKDVSPAVEIEAANGAVTQAAVEKSDTAGIFTVVIPALPQGNYTIRAKLTHGGETDTATFSGMEVKNPSAPATAENGGISWLRTALIGFIFSVVLALFGALIYFVLRPGSAGAPTTGETVSA